MRIDRNQRQPNQPPTGAPPTFTPNEAQATKVGGTANPGGPVGAEKKSMQGQGPSVKAVDPGAIFPCLYRYVYIWPNYGPGFWAYVTFVGPTSIAGWRFNGRRWVYFGMDLKRIRSFYCY